MRRHLRLIVLLTVGLVLLATSPAARAGIDPVIADCESHGYVLHARYTVAELERAINSIPAQQREYTSCAQVIQTQLDKQLAAAHLKGGGSSTGGSGLVVVIVVFAAIIVFGGGAAVFVARKRSAGGGGPQAPTTDS